MAGDIRPKLNYYIMKGVRGCKNILLFSQRRRCFLISPVIVLVYVYVRRNVSNHKQIKDDTVINLISLALMLVASALVICALGIVRCILRLVRGQSISFAPIVSAGEAVEGWTKCVSLKGRNRRLALIVFALSMVTITTKSGLSGGCGSLRTFRDSNGNNMIRLCVKGRWHAPSLYFLLKGGLWRFLGDTFLFRDEATMPQLDWRTAVLQTDQCKTVLRGVREENSTDGQSIYNNNNATSVALAVGPSPKEVPWQTKPERDASLLAPFRVSNELVRPNALQQADLATRHLRECHLDPTSRVVLESVSSDASSRNPLVLEAKSKNGNGTAIVLSASNVVEKNVYHIMHMDSGLHCLFVALENAASSVDTAQIHVILPMAYESSVGNSIVGALASIFGAEVLTLHQNYTYIQQQKYRSLVHVHGPYVTDTIPNLLRSGSVGFSWPIWDTMKFENGRVASSFGIAYANAVRRGNRMRLSQISGQRISKLGDERILVVQRRNSRRLVGSRTGTFAEIVDSMCSLGLTVNVVEFETMTVKEQIQEVSLSTVMVAAHGAGVGNAAWMRPGTAVVEVLMRQGFAGSDYHKADFANLVRFYGKKYVYYDAVSLVPSDAGEINANTIVVDAKELAQVVLCLFEHVRDGS